jgi:hypothetical protein
MPAATQTTEKHIKQVKLIEKIINGVGRGKNGQKDPNGYISILNEHEPVF